MKKAVAVMSSILLTLLLGACGDQLTKDEVVNKAFEKKTTSYQADLKADVEINANGQKMNQSIDFNIEYLEEPFITHLNMTTINGDLELYFDKESAYILQPNTNEWVKTPTNSIEGFAEIASGESLKKEIARIKKFADLFKLEKKEAGYALDVVINDSSSEKEKELVMEVMKESLQDNSQEDAFKIIKVNQFKYTLILTKDYLLKQITATADLDIEINGGSGNIASDIKANYKNVNEVQPFSIPEDVKQNATQIEIEN